ncbi:uncharacterized protein BXZ73DRAFT_96809 [Epithele typhae]|uniref:uncharacterized protein n=1 Tax=Epithele typhae TaxID=378194 RepID=UPI0020084795|nr:uncharacterized protein BXZ73DRAFT_96809 [Epithele typhae]KAH9944322.1 hypothetical protein BXZ73DRAFT_96809 [Epithele typhae]
MAGTYADGLQTGGADLRTFSRVSKRLIVCCDGTWQDALDVRQNWKYTNVLRLARALNYVDDRVEPPVHQIVFYQSGIGTDNLYDKIVDGITGANLAEKVEDAYGFIAHNYHPGDEIFLFGFSRGAYTARMVAMFIGAIGVLDRTQMDHFASIFLAYQKRGKETDLDQIQILDEKLEPWTNPNAPGKMRAQSGPHKFSIKIVGVFDTVGSLGLPEELVFRSKKLKTIFGFPDRLLGEHIARAYHAMAINEDREDFSVAKFEQTEGGRRKGQTLKQCWFSGSHCDIGGGYEEHDLSDVTLNWMVAEIQDALSIDFSYLSSLPTPTAPWGALPFHPPLVGIYSYAKTKERPLPTVTDDVTHEVIHPSVLEQPSPELQLKQHLMENPDLVHQLLPWEANVRVAWDGHVAATTALKTEMPAKVHWPEHDHSIFHKAFNAIKESVHAESNEEDSESNTHSAYVKGWLHRAAGESRVGAVVQELI